MAFLASDVMNSAAVMLNDRGAVRWTAQDLRDYLNAGMREIVNIKPNAKSETRVLTLASGVLQTLPVDVTAVSSFSHNVSAANARLGAIGELNGRALMDRLIPNWTDPAVVPEAAIVVHVIYEIANPREFLVVPANNGTGKIAAVVGAMPAPIPVPGTTPDLIASHTTAVPMPDEYRNPLVDYVLHRAFLKDAGLAGAQGRSAVHLQAFVQAITGKFAAETTMAAPSTSGTSKIA